VAAVGFFLVLALFPFYWMAITSLKPNSELYNRHVMPLVLHHPTLKHYIDLLTQTSFLTWTWNTMLVAIVSTAISLVLGVMLAYPLARMRFAGAGLIAMTVAAIYLVPQPLLFIPLADLINRLNLGNTLTAVILTYPTMLVPFCAWLLLGYFKTVPMELEGPHASTAPAGCRRCGGSFCRCARLGSSRPGSSPLPCRKMNSSTR
jgi:multiple sugar transport system permease protein